MPCSNSTAWISATLASANQGYSAKGSRYSFSPTKSHRPWVEMWVTSAEMLFPRGFDLVFMALDLGLGGFEFGRLEAGIDRELDLGRQPKLGLSVRRVNVNIHPAREKKKNRNLRYWKMVGLKQTKADLRLPYQVHLLPTPQLPHEIGVRNGNRLCASVVGETGGDDLLMGGRHRCGALVGGG